VQRHHTSLPLHLLSLCQSHRWSSIHLRTYSETHATVSKPAKGEGAHLEVTSSNTRCAGPRFTIYGYKTQYNATYGSMQQLWQSERKQRRARKQISQKTSGIRSRSVNVLKETLRVERSVIGVDSRTHSGLPPSRGRSLFLGFRSCEGERATSAADY